MGQVLKRLYELEQESQPQKSAIAPKFPDLRDLPPELGLSILAHLNATDLCLASCVWDQLGNDEILWHGLCRSSWGYCSAYYNPKNTISYKKMFLMLDEACLTFNSHPFQGIDYLIRNGLVEDDPIELSKFIHSTSRLWPEKKREFFDQRRDVLEEVVKLQNLQNKFLPNALRHFFGEISAPHETGNFLSDLIERFSDRFSCCNPHLGLSKDTVVVLCFSLILLSVDLSSPHVKNKMSKREFIKNTVRAAQEVDGDFAGHLYDNIYLIGHVAKVF